MDLEDFGFVETAERLFGALSDRYRMRTTGVLLNGSEPNVER